MFIAEPITEVPTIWLAVKNNNTTIMQALYQYSNHYSKTSSLFNILEIIDTPCLHKDEDSNAKAVAYSTPLHQACVFGYNKCVDLLFKWNNLVSNNSNVKNKININFHGRCVVVRATDTMAQLEIVCASGNNDICEKILDNYWQKINLFQLNISDDFKKYAELLFSTIKSKNFQTVKELCRTYVYHIHNDKNNDFSITRTISKLLAFHTEFKEAVGRLDGNIANYEYRSKFIICVQHANDMDNTEVQLFVQFM